MTRLDRLWRAVDGPGAPPRLDSRRVKAQVNAALDAGQTERKLTMKPRFCTALMIAAVLLAITGTALAAAVHLDALSAWFKGDNAPGLEYLDSQVRTVSDENYTFTVESSAADKDSMYFVVSVSAHSETAKAFLASDDFISMDTFDAWAASSGGKEIPCSTLGSHELETEEGDCRRFALYARFFKKLSAAYQVSIRCGYMEEGKRIELPVSPAPSVLVKIEASGAGVQNHRYRPEGSPDQLTIYDITLSPFTCQIRMSRQSFDIEPRILLRMKDGTIRTQAQFLTGVSDGQDAASYRCTEVLDLDTVASIIVFDMEYPLDGSSPTPAEHNPALDPFTVTRMEQLSAGRGFSIPVRELTEKLGGTFRQEADQTVCTYRDTEIVLKAGSQTALVNGQAVELEDAPAIQNGILAAPYSVFRDAWEIDACVQREDSGRMLSEHEPELIWHDWYIIP